MLRLDLFFFLIDQNRTALKNISNKIVTIESLFACIADVAAFLSLSLVLLLRLFRHFDLFYRSQGRAAFAHASKLDSTANTNQLSALSRCEMRKLKAQHEDLKP